MASVAPFFTASHHFPSHSRKTSSAKFCSGSQESGWSSVQLTKYSAWTPSCVPGRISQIFSTSPNSESKPTLFFACSTPFFRLSKIALVTTLLFVDAASAARCWDRAEDNAPPVARRNWVGTRQAMVTADTEYESEKSERHSEQAAVVPTLLWPGRLSPERLNIGSPLSTLAGPC
eukprot:scaffold2364_cov426-Prasinococcus_capsulatus_cf.AAC.3